MKDQTQEEKYNELVDSLFNLSLLDYNHSIIKYIKDGDSPSVFNKETSNLLKDKYENFVKTNNLFMYALDIFNKLKERKAVDHFNKALKTKSFEVVLSENDLSEKKFIELHAKYTNLKDIEYAHSRNRSIVHRIFSIYYNPNTKKKINLTKLKFFHGKESEKIRKEEDRLNNILNPQPKKQELYPLSLFGIELTVREVAILITFMKGHYNFKPYFKSELLDIAFFIFGDINHELKLKATTNNSALYDYISSGKGLFNEEKEGKEKEENEVYSTAKSKIINALGYEETTKFKRFKSYIKKHDFKGFKRLIKEK